MKDLDKLTGHEFEDLVEDLIKKMGFITEQRKKTADGGIDIKAINEKPLLKGKYIIQCKRYSKPVGEPVLRDLYGVIISQNANKGILITNSVFSKKAKQFAKRKPLELIDGYQLSKLLDEYLDRKVKKKKDKLTIPDKYKMSFEYLDEGVRRIKKRKNDVENNRVYIGARLYKTKKPYISYCERKSDKLVKLAAVLTNQINYFNDVWNRFSADENVYLEARELKKHCKETIKTLESIEKEWEEAISVTPPEGTERLHNSLIDIYEPYFDAFFEILDKLREFFDNPEDFLSEEEKTKSKPTLTIPVTVEGDKGKTFAREMRKAQGAWCFISTAIYGENSPEVITLRRWRDDVLWKTIYGRFLINIYYSSGERLSTLIKKNKFLKDTLRSLLDNFVKLIKRGESNNNV